MNELERGGVVEQQAPEPRLLQGCPRIELSLNIGWHIGRIVPELNEQAGRRALRGRRARILECQLPHELGAELIDVGTIARWDGSSDGALSHLWMHTSIKAFAENAWLMAVLRP